MQPIDIRPDHLRLVLDILQQHVPMAEVWAFGSRAKWLARDTSDLDLCIRDAAPLSFEQMGLLREAFEESNLPYKVDVVDWATISASFRKVVERDKVVVQEAKMGRVMAGEWRRMTLNQLGRIVTGKTPPSSLSNAFGGAIPFVTPSDMDGSRTIKHTARTLTESGAAAVRGAHVPANAVMVSCIGSDMGKAAIAGIDCVTNQQINSIIIETDDSPLYVYYDLSTRKAEIRGAASGSAQPILNKSAFGRFGIELPPPDEQRAIAHILGTLDDKIELNRRMNETLEAIARAIFKSWFVDFDPVRAKASGEPPESICRRLGLTPDLLALFPGRLVDSELGEIPEGWSTASLYEMATYINGAAYRAFEPNEVQRGLPIIKIAELKAGVAAQTKYSDVEMPEKYRINRGDILFSWSGNPDTSIDTFVWSNGPAWLNQHIFRVVPPSELERSFVLAVLKYLRPVFAEIARDKQTTGLGHVTVSDLKRLKCVKPPKSLLISWNEVIGPILERAFLSGLETQTLANHRDTLLPKLLSGELRTHNADSDSEAFA